MVRPWRNRQNEILRALAEGSSGDTLESRSFGKCPGLIPVDKVPEELHFLKQLTKELQENHVELLKELGKMVNENGGNAGLTLPDVNPRWVNGFGKDEGWKQVWLQFLHEDVGDENHMPLLRSILSRYRSHIGLAFISTLLPGAVIEAHCGLLSTVLRYHYGLLVPTPRQGEKELNMALSIMEHQIRWQNKEAFIFDDTYPHSAFNRTDRARIILFLDIIRPMPPLISRINRWLNKTLLKTRYMKEVKSRMNPLFNRKTCIDSDSDHKEVDLGDRACPPSKPLDACTLNK